MTSQPRKARAPAQRAKLITQPQTECRQSPEKKKAFPHGRLIMAASHIGHIDDIPARTLEAARTSSVLVFEEDRPARLVLKTAGVQRTYLKYNEHRQDETIAAIRTALKRGEQVLYCSDQGCPTLADPGHRVVQTARQLQTQITVIPGPSSITAAISVCPFPMTSFHFLGFPPKDKDQRRAWLKKNDRLAEPLIIMDTPYRLQALLGDCREMLSQHKRGFLGVNLSLENELHVIGTFPEMIRETQSLGKQNFVLICA